MGARVLIVDDDCDIRNALAPFLRSEGFVVVEAANGLLALAEIDREVPDLALLDLMMPVLDGWKTLQILRNTPKHANLPVVVLSATVVAPNVARTSSRSRSTSIGSWP